MYLHQVNQYQPQQQPLIQNQQVQPHQSQTNQYNLINQQTFSNTATNQNFNTNNTNHLSIDTNFFILNQNQNSSFNQLSNQHHNGKNYSFSKYISCFQIMLRL